MPIEHKYGCIILTGEESKTFVRKSLHPDEEMLRRRDEFLRSFDMEIRDTEDGFMAAIPGLELPKEEV